MEGLVSSPQNPTTTTARSGPSSSRCYPPTLGRRARRRLWRRRRGAGDPRPGDPVPRRHRDGRPGCAGRPREAYDEVLVGDVNRPESPTSSPRSTRFSPTTCSSTCRIPSRCSRAARRRGAGRPLARQRSERAPFHARSRPRPPRHLRLHRVGASRQHARPLAHPAATSSRVARKPPGWSVERTGPPAELSRSGRPRRARDPRAQRGVHRLSVARAGAGVRLTEMLRQPAGEPEGELVRLPARAHRRTRPRRTPPAAAGRGARDRCAARAAARGSGLSRA